MARILNGLNTAVFSQFYLLNNKECICLRLFCIINMIINLTYGTDLK